MITKFFSLSVAGAALGAQFTLTLDGPSNATWIETKDGSDPMLRSLGGDDWSGAVLQFNWDGNSIADNTGSCTISFDTPVDFFTVYGNMFVAPWDATGTSFKIYDLMSDRAEQDPLMVQFGRQSADGIDENEASVVCDDEDYASGILFSSFPNDPRNKAAGGSMRNADYDPTSGDPQWPAGTSFAFTFGSEVPANFTLDNPNADVTSTIDNTAVIEVLENIYSDELPFHVQWDQDQIVSSSYTIAVNLLE